MRQRRLRCVFQEKCRDELRYSGLEGDQVRQGDTVAILDNPEVMAKYDQAEAAQTAARAFSEKADKGTRSEQIIMAYQTWQKAKAAAEVAKKLSTG